MVYWPTGAAKRLSWSSIHDPQDDLYDPYDQPEEPAASPPSSKVISIKRNRTATLFVALTATDTTLWSVRPAIAIAKLCRSAKSLEEYGPNERVIWRPDSSVIIVQTSQSYLITYTVLTVDEPAYQIQTKSNVQFNAGPGEGYGTRMHMLKFRIVIKIDAEIETAYSTDEYLIVATKTPPAIQCIPWQTATGSTKTNLMSRLEFLTEKKITIKDMIYNKPMDLFGWRTSDGRAYAIVFRGKQEKGSTTPTWSGYCFHGRDKQISSSTYATTISINAKFSLIAVGQQDGTVSIYFVKNYRGNVPLSHSLSLKKALGSTASHLNSGAVTSLSWTADGYALAVGWEKGFSVWSVFGKVLMTSIKDDWEEFVPSTFQDQYLRGVQDLFWNLASTELFMLRSDTNPDAQLWTLAFAKSAITGIHHPDNTKRAFLQMDERLLLYKGADQPDMSAINPDAAVWQHIQIPMLYITTNWPVRYAAISNDGRYIGVAGKRGLAHYSVASNRWKLFGSEQQEQDFTCRGGLVWYKHILIAAVESDKSYELRLFSRETNLDNSLILHVEKLPSPILLLSLFDNSLLVYTSENLVYHFLVVAGKDTVKLQLCGQISFHGIVSAPARVRGMSWMVPEIQQRQGDPMDDLKVATVIFLVDGKLVLLRPRKSDEGELKYDMQVLADKIEYYWMPAKGIGTLENSLWAYDGHAIKIWLDALTIDYYDIDDENDEYMYIEESVRIDLDFYPLSTIMDKGIVVGVENELIVRTNLDFAMFKQLTNTHLFLHHILRYHLARGQEHEAVFFATHYANLVYFGHCLEILLHKVLDEEAEQGLGYEDEKAVLKRVITFLDHFPESLEVVVGCARKTEVALWPYLFGIVGSPQDLFEKCMGRNLLKTAGSYLLVLHNLELQTETSQDTVRLLQKAIDLKDWDLCKELARFLNSIDNSGATLRRALKEVTLPFATPAEVLAEA